MVLFLVHLGIVVLLVGTLVGELVLLPARGWPGNALVLRRIGRCVGKLHAGHARRDVALKSLARDEDSRPWAARLPCRDDSPGHQPPYVASRQSVEIGELLDGPKPASHLRIGPTGSATLTIVEPALRLTLRLTVTQAVLFLSRRFQHTPPNQSRGSALGVKKRESANSSSEPSWDPYSRHQPSHKPTLLPHLEGSRFSPTRCPVLMLTPVAPSLAEPADSNQPAPLRTV